MELFSDSRQLEWEDEDIVPLSALQHYSYCPRQFALIHVEQAWQENVYTAKGRWGHERVDEEGKQSHEDVEVLTALAVWSDQYGLAGRCDRVEIRDGVPFPVEFKHGRLRSSVHDELQLCGQALCLEEMFGVPVRRGAIYHIQSRHRREVVLDEPLRRRVVEVIEAIRRTARSGELPRAVNDARCRHCSLQAICLPEATDGHIPENWSDWPPARHAVWEEKGSIGMDSGEPSADVQAAES